MWHIFLTFSPNSIAYRNPLLYNGVPAFQGMKRGAVLLSAVMIYGFHLYLNIVEEIPTGC